MRIICEVYLMPSFECFFLMQKRCAYCVPLLVILKRHMGVVLIAVLTCCNFRENDIYFPCLFTRRCEQDLQGEYTRFESHDILPGIGMWYKVHRLERNGKLLKELLPSNDRQPSTVGSDCTSHQHMQQKRSMFYVNQPVFITSDLTS